MKHHIERTSPKEQEFIGTCRLCGVSNLRMSDALKDCENIRGLTKKEAFIETLKGK